VDVRHGLRTSGRYRSINFEGEEEIMTVTNATQANQAQFVSVASNSGNDKSPPATDTSSNKPVTGLAAALAAKAQYLKTGIDKDAAIGDPDHDAPKKAPTPSNTSTSGVNITA
jgi:hypothetical protein